MLSRQAAESISTSGGLRREITLVAKNSLVYLVGNALSRAVGFFMIPVYTRFIAPKNYGAMELIEIVTAALALLLAMGASDSMSRFYYGEKDQAKRNSVISTVILGLSSIGIPIVLVFIALSKAMAEVIFEEPQYGYFLQVALAGLWFSMLCEVGYSYLRMIYKAKLFVVITTIQLLIALSLNILFVVLLRIDILGIFYSTFLTQGLAGLAMAIGIIRKVGVRIDLGLLREIIRFGLPLVPSRVGLMLGFVSNRFFLRWMSSPDPSVALGQIGLFSLGHKFGVIVNRFVNAPFNSFWSPRKFDLLLNGEKNSRQMVAKVCTYSTLCVVYITLVLCSGVKSLMDIMADAAYKGAHVVVPFVALSYIALDLETHFMTGILYAKKTKWATYVTMCSLLVVLAWNILFVPRWGLIGAATSNLAGFVIRIVIIYLISQSLLPIPFELGRLGLLFGAALLLYLASQWVVFDSAFVTFFARTSISLLFPLLLFPLGFFTDGEKEFLRSSVRSVSGLLVAKGGS